MRGVAFHRGVWYKGDMILSLIVLVFKVFLGLLIIGVIVNLLDSLVLEPVLRYFGRRVSTD